MKASIYSISIICIIGGLVFFPLNPEWWEIERRTEEKPEGNVSEERYSFLELFDDFGLVLLVLGITLIPICYAHSKMIEQNKERNNTT